MSILRPNAISFSISRGFLLALTPSRQVFAPGVKFLLNEEETTGYDPRTFYQGRVVGAYAVLVRCSLSLGSSDIK